MKTRLTRLLDGYETVAVESLDDGSVLVHVESTHPDLLLATFAVPAEAVGRLDLRPFPDARLKQRERMREHMRRKREDPDFRARERVKNRERMRKARSDA